MPILIFRIKFAKLRKISRCNFEIFVIYFITTYFWVCNKIFWKGVSLKVPNYSAIYVSKSSLFTPYEEHHPLITSNILFQGVLYFFLILLLSYW